MKQETKILLTILVSYLVYKLWVILPESTDVRDYFPFADQKLTLRMHIYFICERLATLIIIYAFKPFLRNPYFNILFVIYALDILDYLLFYCEPIIMIGPLPVEYGLIKGVLLISLLSFYIKNEHT
jgi:hypothetical protein